MIAAAVATPVAERLTADPIDGRVLGSSLYAVYIDCGFVVAITARDVPAMPDGVVLGEPHIAPAPTIGEGAQLSRTRIDAGDLSLDLGPARLWDPGVSRNDGASPGEVGRRGRGLLRNCRVSPAAGPAALLRSLAATSGLKMLEDPGGRDGLSALLGALQSRDAGRASEASRTLLGRGGGLTPEGDDIVGAAIATVCAFGAACGLTGSARAGLFAALAPPDLRERTTSLSATLVELAVQGYVVEPVQSLLDLALAPERWRPELRRLMTIGHSTGRAWAVGCGAAALLLATGAE